MENQQKNPEQEDENKEIIISGSAHSRGTTGNAMERNDSDKGQQQADTNHGRASYTTGSTTQGGSNFGQGSSQLGGGSYKQGDTKNEGANYNNEKTPGNDDENL